jgi:thiopeptide-type bacteriocin biosynthesis protein
MVAELAVAGRRDPVQPSAELTVRVHAASVRALERGRFTLHVTGVSRTAGATAGRFLSLFDDGDKERMSALYAALPAVHRSALLAQISAPPLYASADHIARAPLLTDLVITLGEYRARPAGQIPVTDLAVTADTGRLHLVSLSHRQPVHTLLLNAVDLAFHSHPMARFLVEAPVALATPCTGFEWGAATALPFLPALRYGRTIVSPARWILAARDLPGPATAWPQWNDALASATRNPRLPKRVLLGEGDQSISLDLAEPAHRALLRTHLDRAGKATLRAAPAPRDLGWTGGRVHEIVIPLAAAGPAQDPVRWPGEVTGQDHGHLPGCDSRISLSLYGPRARQDSILTRHLPSLLGQLGDQTRWWFIRYADPGDHLRLRLTLPPGKIGSAVEQVSAWTRTLRRAGLIERASWDTYFPETARFGGTAAMGRAEEFFAADSAAAVAQLSAVAGENAPDARALTAASLVDITIGLIGDDTTAMLWLTEHTRADSTPPPRALYDEAVALAGLVSLRAADTPAVGAEVAAAWQRRRISLAAYRGALEHAGTLRPQEPLPDLLHLHQARISGPDLARERLSLHLARAAALSRLARARNTSRS